MYSACFSDYNELGITLFFLTEISRGGPNLFSPHFIRLLCFSLLYWENLLSPQFVIIHFQEFYAVSFLWGSLWETLEI